MAASIREPAAFGEIYDRHADRILRYLVRRVGPGDAEELFGEVFRIAFERRTSFDRGRSSAGPWLYGIASNLLRKRRRSEARRLSATVRLGADRERAQPPQEVTVDARIALRKVAEAVQALPDGEREALLLFAWEELGYEEIAHALEVPVGTVRSRLSRARKRLRELTASSGEERGDPPGREPGTERR